MCACVVNVYQPKVLAKSPRLGFRHGRQGIIVCVVVLKILRACVHDAQVLFILSWLKVFCPQRSDASPLRSLSALPAPVTFLPHPLHSHFIQFRISSSHIAWLDLRFSLGRVFFSSLKFMSEVDLVWCNGNMFSLSQSSSLVFMNHFTRSSCRTKFV